MKNALIVAASLLLLAIITLFIFMTLAGSAEKKADGAFASIEPEESFEKRYPATAAKNSSAARVETLAEPLQIELHSRQEIARPRGTEMDPKLTRLI